MNVLTAERYSGDDVYLRGHGGSKPCSTSAARINKKTGYFMAVDTLGGHYELHRRNQGIL